MPRNSNPPAPSPDRHVRTADQTRTEILQAARRQFLTHGFDGARINNIARQANIHQSLIYYYFKSKEQLFIAVSDAITLPYYQVLESILSTTPIDREWLEQFIRSYFNFLRDAPDATALHAWWMASRDWNRTVHFGERGMQLWHRLLLNIQQLEQNGDIRSGVDVQGLLYSIISLVEHWHIGWSSFHELQVTSPEEKTLTQERRLKQIIDLLLHGVVSR